MTHASVTLKTAHISMQAQDSDAQRRIDARRMMERVALKNYHWLTGTEGHELAFRASAKFHAARLGLHFFEYKSNFIVVNKSRIVPGSYDRFAATILPNDDVVGKMHDPSLTSATFEVEGAGRVTASVSHYPRFGRPSSKDPVYHQNLKANKKIAKFIGVQAQARGAGNKLYFYSGDQNILDNVDDSFFGQRLTSVQDELGKYPNTGHGPIDVIASSDRDHRVAAKDLRVFNDKQVPFFSDHYLLEADFTVLTL